MHVCVCARELVSWEMQIIQMEQLVLMKSNMRTQVVPSMYMNTSKYGIFVKNTVVCEFKLRLSIKEIPFKWKRPFFTFCKNCTKWNDWTKQSLLCFLNTICCVAIELLLMRNHTEVNALLLCKRLDMLEHHNGGHGRQRLWSNSCYI